ncbi:MAG TPA: N,N-dimethylformamidase beta subunit family domain-containing protein, partial [Thermoanaerobaculia bacterium]
MATRRQFLKRTALTGVGLAVAPAFSRRALAGVGPYAQAYPGQLSIDPGETLTLHVSTDMPEFRVQIYRQGATLEWYHTSDWMPGGYYQPVPAHTNFEWPAYEIRTGYDWPSGAYIAMIETRDRSGIVYSPDFTTADGEQAKALFVLRRAASSSASLLYKLATNTYHAFNHGREFDDFGKRTGGNLYSHLKPYDLDGNMVGFAVTMQRPGGGTGGDWEDGGFAATQADPYDPSSRRNCFAHWD